MFVLKKIVAPFFFPFSVCMELLIAGLILLWFTRRQKAGKLAVTAGFLLLALLSYEPIPALLLRPLERRYPAIAANQPARSAKWVVVLGGGNTEDKELPWTSNLSHSSLTRLTEGLRLLNQNPNAKLILSGGAPFGTIPNAVAMAELAKQLGANADRLVLESKSRDTGEEAQYLKDLLGSDPFLMVTSASHMPRAMRIFENAGMHPIPAPTDHDVIDDGQLSPRAFFPNPAHVGRAERAVYEYLGVASSKLLDTR